MKDEDQKDISTTGIDEQQGGSEKRRAALRKILVGGGVVSAGSMLPEKWTGTVLQSIVLPAHAQMSGGIAAAIFAGVGPAPGT